MSTYVTLKDGDTATVGAFSAPDSYTLEVSTSLGVRGYTGSVGSNGSIGYTGSQGVGFTGSSGTVGFTGSTGAIGSVGFTGSASTVIGYTGSAGSNGSVGFTGSSGTTGFTGSVGAAFNADGSYTWTNTQIFSNTITFNANVSGNTAGFAIGYRDVPQNFTNTNYTFALTDAGKHILTQNSGSSTQTLTIPNNAIVAYQTGAAIAIVVQSAGTIALANGAGVTMYLAGNSTAKSSITLNSYSQTTALKIGSDTWFVTSTSAV